MMASHGVTVIGESVAQAFNDLYYLECAAMFQVLARSTGGQLRQVGISVRDKLRAQTSSVLSKLAERHFTALKRILDKEETGYRK